MLWTDVVVSALRIPPDCLQVEIALNRVLVAEAAALDIENLY
ncbi:hypothetical protein [Rhizobium mesoamericanum]|nr:hypothetical protein [Rhizobium mesoamericanum]